jgi:hypothetical protein
MSQTPVLNFNVNTNNNLQVLGKDWIIILSLFETPGKSETNTFIYWLMFESSFEYLKSTIFICQNHLYMLDFFQ